MKKDFIFVIAVFLGLLIIFTDISIYESFGSVRSRKLEAENLAVLCASHIERNCNHTFQLNGIMASFVLLGEVSDEEAKSKNDYNYKSRLRGSHRAAQNKILRNCVRVARQTLTLFVWVRILVPQPSMRIAILLK